MSAVIIDGAAVAHALRANIAKTVAQRAEKGLRPPGLAVVLVGDDPASHVYVKSKARASEEAGIRSVQHTLSADTSETNLLSLIGQLNADKSIDGILVQLPLPPGIDPRRVIDAIDPTKDVDSFHPLNVGRLAIGLPSFIPCTPLGCLRLLETVRPNMAGLSAVIVGRSNIVGKPVAQLLLVRNCTVTIAHSQTTNLPALCRQADILIAAVGHPHMIKGDWIKPGAIVVDVGINRLPPEPGQTKGRLVGDVDFEEARRFAGAITPVPGGVGPMTIACLLSNTLDSAVRREQPTFKH
ncbi:MAG: bifunctional methylenetetrahydrofolate dehydrogenase/methenyltetrahydrofolate cyclohydrolase FolD [Afipia sp.]